MHDFLGRSFSQSYLDRIERMFQNYRLSMYRFIRSSSHEIENIFKCHVECLKLLLKKGIAFFRTRFAKRLFNLSIVSFFDKIPEIARNKSASSYEHFPETFSA
jgi:hypothetical protein